MSAPIVTAAPFVVVGGGSSGATVAGGLAEQGRHVVLLEAGPDYGPLTSGRWPSDLLDATALALSHDWGYASGRWTYERARVIGGCSSHNGAIAAVGHRFDYDDWGLPGWRGDDVAPAYAAVIDRMRVRAYERSEAGPFHERCLQAAEGAGWTIASDLCDLDALGSFGLETVNVVDGVRWNTAFAYLDPVRDGGNLEVVDHVLVDRIEAVADGVLVHAERHGEPVSFVAGVLVVAAGVYGTPGILQRSGVGDPARLAAAGIEVRVALPEVGGNLHDHPMAHADRRVTPELQGWLDEAAAAGFLPEEQTLGKARSSLDASGRYDLHLFPVCASTQVSLLHGRVHVEVACLTPRSRGRVDVASPDPHAAPVIDHGYLTDPDDHDLTVLMDGLVLAEELLAQSPLASVLGEPISDSADREAVRAQAAHYYHPVGTCAMGLVCDARGFVNGLDNVVVADASLFPQIPRANTNLPAVMLGERIAGWL